MLLLLIVWIVVIIVRIIFSLRIWFLIFDQITGWCILYDWLFKVITIDLPIILEYFLF